MDKRVLSNNLSQLQKIYESQKKELSSTKIMCEKAVKKLEKYKKEASKQNDLQKVIKELETNGENYLNLMKVDKESLVNVEDEEEADSRRSLTNLLSWWFS